MIARLLSESASCVALRALKLAARYRSGGKNKDCLLISAISCAKRKLSFAVRVVVTSRDVSIPANHEFAEDAPVSEPHVDPVDVHFHLGAELPSKRLVQLDFGIARPAKRAHCSRVLSERVQALSSLALPPPPQKANQRWPFSVRRALEEEFRTALNA